MFTLDGDISSLLRHDSNHYANDAMRDGNICFICHCLIVVYLADS